LYSYLGRGLYVFPHGQFNNQLRALKNLFGAVKPPR
jgi:hypothetical protein